MKGTPMWRKLPIPITIVIIALAAATMAYASSGGHSNLDGVRGATAKFHDPAKAGPAGYGRFVDVNGVACIDMPGLGAMGVHYVSQQLVGNASIDPQAPEALIYAPDGKGGQKLVAVEYLVVKAAWDATNSAPPSLFGHTFDFTSSPNRFGLPDFYSLHAWVWKHNPAGVFTMWNPDVHCPSWTG